MTAQGKIVASVRTLASKVARGFLVITHNSFALLGLAVVSLAIALLTLPELRMQGEEQLHGWLQARQASSTEIDPEPLEDEQVLASNPKKLPKDQASVAYWLSKKYRVAPEPLATLVAEAYDQGVRHQLDPTLILAVMAIESRFNPFAQSPVGAQGLMQVMTRIHHDKYQSFGGRLAAFDPVSNLRVGVSVLKECIARAGGSLEGGLRYYVGAAHLEDDGGYAAKVLAENQRLRLVSQGRTVPVYAPPPPAASVPAPLNTPADTEKVALWAAPR